MKTLAANLTYSRRTVGPHPRQAACAWHPSAPPDCVRGPARTAGLLHLPCPGARVPQLQWSREQSDGDGPAAKRGCAKLLCHSGDFSDAGPLSF